MAKKPSNIKKLLFVDTNIFLDFYRARNDTGLSLLNHLEKISDKIITTYQVEMEFKKNRQVVMLEGVNELKPIGQISRPGIFSDAKAAEAAKKQLEAANKRIASLRNRLIKALKNPSSSDPVYKVCQRIFKKDTLNLNRESDFKKIIQKKALKRFFLGCPPRKKNDTSIGDAINWEWMVHCAIQGPAELVIVSRDSDYGVSFDNHSFINDHLRQEFSDRVSKKRDILLYNKLSSALKHFEVPVGQKEIDAEDEILSSREAQDRAIESTDDTDPFA